MPASAGAPGRFGPDWAGTRRHPAALRLVGMLHHRHPAKATCEAYKTSSMIALEVSAERSEEEEVVLFEI